MPGPLRICMAMRLLKSQLRHCCLGYKFDYKNKFYLMIKFKNLSTNLSTIANLI